MYFLRIKTFSCITTVQLSKSGHLKWIGYTFYSTELFQILLICPKMTFTARFFPRSKIQSRNTLLGCKNTLLAAYPSHLLLLPTTPPTPQLPLEKTSRPRTWRYPWRDWLRKIVGNKRKAYLTKISSAITEEKIMVKKNNNGIKWWES